MKRTRLEANALVTVVGREISSEKACAAINTPTKVRSRQVRPSEIRSREIRATDIPVTAIPVDGTVAIDPMILGPCVRNVWGFSWQRRKHGIRQIHTRQVHPSEVSTRKVGSSEARAREVGSSETRAFQIRSVFDCVAVDFHDNHATGRPPALPEGPTRRSLRRLAGRNPSARWCIRWLSPFQGSHR